MSSQNNLEITGNLREHQLAELLIEIFQAKLNGSLRLSNAAQKSVVYFDGGDVVFAVSNARQFRFFEMLLSENKLTKEQLAAIPDFTNDLALKEHLLKTDFLPKSEIDGLFSRQIKEILKETFGWRAGAWNFSPFVRLKGDIRFKIDAPVLLVEYARNLPVEELPRNFKSLQEIFVVKPSPPARIDLQPEEAFVFSRFENASLNVEKVKILSGLPESATLQILYTLWLGGFLTRQNWNSPFSDRRVSAILSANLILKKEDAPPVLPTKLAAENGTPQIVAEEDAPKIEKEIPVEEAISLEEYLERTENAPTLYKMFGVSPDADTAEIKRAYFTFARRFHPDLFHQQIVAEKHKQIQNAFTRVAQAYETLKNENTRTVYDYKMRKELAEMENSPAQSIAPEDRNLQKQIKQAEEDFERGFSLLMEENFEDALPCFARAAHLAPANARYHAYYGKLLGADAKQKHKAEAELQTAIRLDPDNADIRLMLAEFFVQMKLFKRAEGELNRLLSSFPGNREAKTLLDSLAKR